MNFTRTAWRFRIDIKPYLEADSGLAVSFCSLYGHQWTCRAHLNVSLSVLASS